MPSSSASARPASRCSKGNGKVSSSPPYDSWPACHCTIRRPTAPQRCLANCTQLRGSPLSRRSTQRAWIWHARRRRSSCGAMAHDDTGGGQKRPSALTSLLRKPGPSSAAAGNGSSASRYTLWVHDEHTSDYDLFVNPAVFPSLPPGAALLIQSAASPTGNRDAPQVYVTISRAFMGPYKQASFQVRRPSTLCRTHRHQPRCRRPNRAAVAE